MYLSNKKYKKKNSDWNFWGNYNNIIVIKAKSGMQAKISITRNICWIKVENVDNLNQKSIITIANGKLIWILTTTMMTLLQ
jgi:hypothetical protein